MSWRWIYQHRSVMHARKQSLKFFLQKSIIIILFFPAISILLFVCQLFFPYLFDWTVQLVWRALNLPTVWRLLCKSNFEPFLLKHFFRKENAFLDSQYLQFEGGMILSTVFLFLKQFVMKKESGKTSSSRFTNANKWSSMLAQTWN